MKRNCGCKIPCSCGDTVFTTPPSCCDGNPACPAGDPCAETFNSCCIIYTGDTIANLDIKQGDRVCDIIQKLAALIVNPGCFFPTAACQGAVGFFSTLITATTIKLKWAAVSVATQYQVEYRLTTVGTWSLNPVVATSATPTDTIGGLLPNSVYFVRVKTFCPTDPTRDTAIPTCYSLVLQIKTTA